MHVELILGYLLLRTPKNDLAYFLLLKAKICQIVTLQKNYIHEQHFSRRGIAQSSFRASHLTVGGSNMCIPKFS